MYLSLGRLGACKIKLRILARNGVVFACEVNAASDSARIVCLFMGEFEHLHSMPLLARIPN